MIIWIAGVPRAGKTTLAAELAERHGLDQLHTDSLREAPWAEVPELLLSLVRGRTGYVLEGVQVGRMIRRAGETRDPSRPDRVLWMPRPRQHLALPGQRSMAKGVETVWQDSLKVLRAWGVEPEAL